MLVYLFIYFSFDFSLSRQPHLDEASTGLKHACMREQQGACTQYDTRREIPRVHHILEEAM
jgi:hypothetical protein